MSKEMKKLAKNLGKHGWKVDLIQTQHPGDARRYARLAAQEGTELVLAAGGDGTVNEAVNGVVGTETILGLIPVGTGNILAHQLRMPIISLPTMLHFHELTAALLHSRIQRVDVGIADGRRFLCWAGIGLDAEVTAQMEPRPRYAKQMRLLPYIIAAVTVASEFKGIPTHARIDGRKVRTHAVMFLASNIQLYGTFPKMARNARMDDGLLEVLIFKGMGMGYVLEHVLRIFSGRHLNDPKVIYRPARQIIIETSPPTAVQLDGEPYGQTPSHIQVEPAALRLLVPPHAPVSLFTKPPELIL